jgi:hypothetical protein
LTLIFYARKLQIKVYKHCTTVHCAYANHYVLLPDEVSIHDTRTLLFVICFND